eukprot:jgi/Bigna1/146636/aug1.118_g21344
MSGAEKTDRAKENIDDRFKDEVRYALQKKFKAEKRVSCGLFLPIMLYHLPTICQPFARYDVSSSSFDPKQTFQFSVENIELQFLALKHEFSFLDKVNAHELNFTVNASQMSA